MTSEKFGIDFETALQLQREWTNAGNVTRHKTILIYSTWRSGSSFLGGMFEASPSVMYLYEPFQDFGTKYFRLIMLNFTPY